MSTIYRTFTINPVTAAQARGVHNALALLDTRGVTSTSFTYDPSTTTLVLDICVDTDELPEIDPVNQPGVRYTAADLRTRFRTFCQNHFGRLPNVDVASSPGVAHMSGKDRAQQFIDAWNNNVDPETIGVHGATLAERRATLQRYMNAAKQAWRL